VREACCKNHARLPVLPNAPVARLDLKVEEAALLARDGPRHVLALRVVARLGDSSPREHVALRAGQHGGSGRGTRHFQPGGCRCGPRCKVALVSRPDDEAVPRDVHKTHGAERAIVFCAHGDVTNEGHSGRVSLVGKQVEVDRTRACAKQRTLRLACVLRKVERNNILGYQTNASLADLYLNVQRQAVIGRAAGHRPLEVSHKEARPQARVTARIKKVPRCARKSGDVRGLQVGHENVPARLVL